VEKRFEVEKVKEVKVRKLEDEKKNKKN